MKRWREVGRARNARQSKTEVGFELRRVKPIWSNFFLTECELGDIGAKNFLTLGPYGVQVFSYLAIHLFGINGLRHPPRRILQHQPRMTTMQAVIDSTIHIN